MHKILAALGTFMTIACTPAWAGTQTGQVIDLSIRASDGLIYFYMNGMVSGRPACAVKSPYWVLKDERSATAEKQFALLLEARKTGQVITVIGSDTCLRESNGEDVNYIRF